MCQSLAGHIIQIIDLVAAYVYFIYFEYCACDIYVLILYLLLKHVGRLNFCIIFGPKREEVTGCVENYIMRSLMVCTPHPILFG